MNRAEPLQVDIDPVADLRLAGGRRRRTPLPPPRPATATPRRHRSGWLGRLHVLPIVYLSALSLLGYTFATRSIAAFSNAWRNTDTRNYPNPAPNTPPTASEEAPRGPFGSVVSSPGALQGIMPFLSRSSLSSDGAVVAAAPGNSGTY